MKHDEKAIKKIAQQVINSVTDLVSQYTIQKVTFDGDALIDHGTFKGEKLATWIISINDTRLFDPTLDFLYIRDEDGVPLFIRNKHQVLEIEKVGGNYVFKE